MPSNYDYGGWILTALTMSNGGQYYNEDYGGEVYYDTPSMLGAMTFWNDLVFKHKVHPAGEQKADDLHDLRRQYRKQYAQRGCGENADQNRLASLRLRQAGGCKADDDCIVSGQHQVDQNDLQQGGEGVDAEEFRHGSCSPSCRESDPVSTQDSR